MRKTRHIRLAVWNRYRMETKPMRLMACSRPQTKYPLTSDCFVLWPGGLWIKREKRQLMPWLAIESWVAFLCSTACTVSRFVLYGYIGLVALENHARLVRLCNVWAVTVHYKKHAMGLESWSNRMVTSSLLGNADYCFSQDKWLVEIFCVSTTAIRIVCGDKRCV